MFTSILLLLLLIQKVVSQSPATTPSDVLNGTILQQKQQYEANLHSSIQLERQDKILLSSWTVDFQVQRVNIATEYRMQMNRHKDHSFGRTDGNSKWLECVFLQRKQIRRSEKQYYENESECLTTITAEDTNRMKAVELLEREIRKWRNSYRYLVNTFNTENPGDKEASTVCLIQYMETDNYSQVIKRLMVLKLEAMGELFLQLNNSILDLEECLKTQLSAYLEKVRTMMKTLNKCYSLTTPDSEGPKVARKRSL